MREFFSEFPLSEVIEDKHYEEDEIVDSEVKKHVNLLSSSGISALTLLGGVGTMTIFVEVGGKERKADSQCKNVVTLHFIRRIQ